MSTTKSSVAFEYRLVSNFESVRRTLLDEKLVDRLDKPLAYWALPNDRRLPLAFMGRTIKELLETPFNDLYSTPGIGEKKIASLIELLTRAARNQPLEAMTPAPLEVAEEAPSGASTENEEASALDAAMVSEAVWAQWRQTVCDHEMGGESLGRFARRLQDLPRVIWQTPLETYTGLTLAEIRSLKTHGEKRVCSVLEVFGALHAILSPLAKCDYLAVRLRPRIISRLEAWLVSALQRNKLPAEEELRNAFVKPLVEQIRMDAGEQIAELVVGRLGFHGVAASVRQAARQMGLTRARVYQLLGDAGAIMDVRWPEGRLLADRLRNRLWTDLNFASLRPGLSTTSAYLERYEEFETAIQLFFPEIRRDFEFVTMQPADNEEAGPRREFEMPTEATA